MQAAQILPVLYDLAVTIGGELELKPLLTRTLQRLLYHTSFSAGFICLDMPPCVEPGTLQAVHLDAVVGDFDLISRMAEPVALPCELLYGDAARVTQQVEGLHALGLTRNTYRAACRLPLGQQGVIVLLADVAPDTLFDLTRVFQPVLAQLDRAIALCRAHEAQQRAAQQNQQHLAHSLKEAESQYKALMEISPMGVGLSSDGIIVDANAAFLNLMGYATIDELRGRPLLDCIEPTQRAAVQTRLQRRATGQSVEASYESVGLRQDGSTFPFWVSSKRLETDQGPRTLSYFIDLTEQKSRERELQALGQRLRLVLETVPARIFWKDLDSRYLGCNTAFARDAGLRHPDELVGKRDTEMGWAEQADLYRADDLKVMQSGQPKLNFEEPQTTPDGQQIWLRTSKVPLLGARGEVIGMLGLYDDITEQKRAQAQIHQLANYDSLTGLPNRALLLGSLTHALSVSARALQHGALLFVDLDDFKSFNDAKGPAAGDELLKAVGARLQASVRGGGVVARSGGDLFIVMLTGLNPTATQALAQVEAVIDRLREVLSAPLDADAGLPGVTVSVGVVLFVGQVVPADTLLKHADTAMNQAKQSGRNSVRFFDPRMQAELDARLALLTDLRQALENQQLVLYFQKQVTAQGRAVGAEVLLRWAHPQRGVVAPGQFIGLAEDTGLIIPIGWWALRQACEQLRRWQSRSGLCDLTLAVNVSAKQFRQPDFVDQVRRVLVQTAAKPSHLKLELTESLVLDNVDDTITKMQAIKLLGVSFSMDDFGTGYSSLQYLKRLPLDQLKIDQSFVRDIVTDPNDAAIVRTIVAMTDALGLNVIAEGVETVEQKSFLQASGCHTFQGYLFGRPMPLAQFEADCLDVA